MLVAGPGDALLRVDKSRNLENIFGASDIFGRRTDEGYAELRFAGVEPDGTIVLYRNELAILTNETTVSESRFPFEGASTVTNRSGTDPRNFSQTSSTTAYKQTEDFHTLIPGDAVEIRLPQGARTLVFEGFRVSILAIEPFALTYTLARIPGTIPEPSGN